MYSALAVPSGNAVVAHSTILWQATCNELTFITVIASKARTAHTDFLWIIYYTVSGSLNRKMDAAISNKWNIEAVLPSSCGGVSSTPGARYISSTPPERQGERIIGIISLN